jgi:hypothetical protein
MFTTLVLIAAVAGLLLLVLLFVAPVDERDTWLASTRRRVRRERMQSHLETDDPQARRREDTERQTIERKLEEERARATLQKPD